MLLPLVINLFARLIGLGGLAKRVMKIFKKIRKRIDKAVNKILAKAKKAGRKLMRKLGIGKKKDKKKKGEKDDRSDKEMKADLKKGVVEATKFVESGKKDKKEIKKQFKKIEQKYSLKKLKLIVDGQNKAHVRGEVNPILDGAPIIYESDITIVKKVKFIQNQQTNPDKGIYQSDIKKRLLSIENDLISPDIGKKKAAIKSLREKEIKKWHVLEGAIYAPFIQGQTEAIEKLDESAQEDIKKNKQTKTETILTSIERGGSLVADQLNNSGVDQTLIEKKFNVDGDAVDSQIQRISLLQRLEDVLSARNGRPTHLIVTETFVGGGSVNNLLNGLIKTLLAKYSNVTVKLLVLQQSGNEEIDKNPEDAANRDAELRGLVEANKLVIVSAKTRMILGEDVTGQAINGHGKSKSPFLVFKAVEDKMEAYQLSPKEGHTTKDVLLELTSGKLKGKIGTIH